MNGRQVNSVILKVMMVAAGAGLLALVQVRNKCEIVSQFPVQTVVDSNRHARNDDTLKNELKLKLQQRNEISRQLNEMKRMFGQANCQHLADMKKAGVKIHSQVSESGGWCMEVSGSNSTEHKLDMGFAEALSSFLADKSVGSFGDGPGLYKKVLEDLGKVKSYTAYDGAPFCEQITNGKVKFLDFTAPLYGLPAFDWVMSVEVGEHIPAKYENIYLDNLVRHAREGLILSWAVPGQGGLSHVNNKPLEEVKQLLGNRGFSIDIEAGGPLRNSSKFKWLQKNVHVYRRNEPSSFIEDDV